MAALAGINITAVISLRNLPVMAEYGWASFGLLLLAAAVFLIPLGLVSADLAAGWPQAGGLYAWVREGLGPKAGALAIWADWAQNLVWAPSMLLFLATTLAHAVAPGWREEKAYLLVVMLAGLWGATFINLRDARVATRGSNAAMVIGTLVPAVLLIVLAILYGVGGGGSRLEFPPEALVPRFELTHWAFFSSVVLSYAGIEMAGFHVEDAEHPQRDLPRAAALSGFVIFTVLTTGSLAIACVIDSEKLSVVDGLMQAVEIVCEYLGVPWLSHAIALMITGGAGAVLATWLLGPAKGVEQAAEEGALPRVLAGRNAQGAPRRVLLIQAWIGTLLSLVILVAPGVTTAYWMLLVLAAQLLAVMYGLVFVAFLCLRLAPTVPDPTCIPGGRLGVWVTGSTGLFACVLAFVLGIFPPDQLEIHSPRVYVSLMLFGLALLLAPPIVYLARR